MKAINFVREKGIEQAKQDIAAHRGGFFTRKDFLDANDFDISEIQSIVESFELVEAFDSIEQAKAWLSFMDCEEPYGVIGYSKQFTKLSLEHAISLYESCTQKIV